MDPLRDDAARAVRAAGLVRLLAHPARLRLLAALCEDERTEAELVARLRLDPGAIRRHLAPLEAAGLVGRASPPPGSEAAAAPTFRIAEPALHGLVACLEDFSR
jgi:ArsR family transcriptional regulator